MVQVPRLQRIQSQTNTPEDRLNLKVSNPSNLIAERTQQITGLADQGAKLYTDIENSKIETISNEAEQKYEIWKNEKLNKLKAHQGDPTEAYNSFYAEEEEFSKGILTDYEGASDRVKRHLASNLGKVRDNRKIQYLNQQGAQQETYEYNNYTSTLKIKKDNLPVSAGAVSRDVDGRYNFALFNREINDITGLVAKYGLKDGTVEELPSDSKEKADYSYTDPDGVVKKVKMSSIAKERLNKELSSGVTDSVTVLLNTNRLDEAKALHHKYKGIIDPVNASKLEKHFNESNVEQAAKNEMIKIQSVHPDEQLDKALAIKDPLVRGKTLLMLKNEQTRIKELKKGKEDRNYEKVMNRVDQIKSEGKVYGLESILSDPKIKPMLPHLSETQKQVLREDIDTPKVTVQSQLSKVQAIVFGDDKSVDINTISPAKFKEYLVGLDEVDKRRMNKAYEEIRGKDGKKSSKTRVAYNDAYKLLRKELFDRDLIDMSDSGKPAGEDDYRKINQAEGFLLTYLQVNNVDDKTPQEGVRKHIKLFIDSMLTEKTFGFGGNLDFSEERRAKPKTETVNTLTGKSTLDVNKLKLKFKKETGAKSYPVNSDPIFLEWVGKQ